MVSGADCLGRVLGRMRAIRGAAEAAGIRGGVTEAKILLIFHFERLFQLSDSSAIVRPERFRSGASVGRRIAHLFVAFFVGVVSRVSSLLAALTGVGALGVKRSIDDLAGRRWQGW